MEMGQAFTAHCRLPTIFTITAFSNSFTKVSNPVEEGVSCMSILKKYLVLVDGSERSVQTAEYIRAFMPVDSNTQIVLFHVLGGLPEPYRDLEDDSNCDEVLHKLNHLKEEQKIKFREYLDRVKQILISGGFPEKSIEIKLHLLEKGVARDIIEEARKGYTAVVMRRRGMGALTSIILGSVAVKLLQALTFIPIILVGQAPPVKKILLAVDESSFSMKAVDFVASLLGGQGYEVGIFHAIIGLDAVTFEIPAQTMPEPHESALPDSCLEAFKIRVTRLFQNIRGKLVRAGFAPEKISEKIRTGVYSRSDAIVKEAQDGGYSTIVVGRRGLSQVDAFFMGRVGHEVVYGGKNFTVWVVG
jgi:nucleotide-binding universal stress UspA family protein